jgi:cytochrome c553
MREHFTSGVLIRDALIAGDLALARWNATWLAEREPEPDVASWSPSMTDLRARARQVAEAQDLPAAAAATAELAAECGRCHATNGVSPRFAERDPRVPASGRRPHMLEHQFAAEQMWGGLIGANEAAWKKGAEGLAVAPLGQEEILENASATQRITALAGDVHALGAEGANASTWPQRATVYGRLLATCATCHAETVRR